MQLDGSTCNFGVVEYNQICKEGLKMSNEDTVTMQIYNSALMINDACRTQDAVIYLRDQMSVVRENHTSILCSDSSRWLDKLFSGQLYSMSYVVRTLLLDGYQR